MTLGMIAKGEAEKKEGGGGGGGGGGMCLYKSNPLIEQDVLEYS